MQITSEAERVGNLRLKRLVLNMAGAFVGVIASGVTQAGTIDVGNPDVKMSWDNTVKYSAGWRVANPDNAVAGDPGPGTMQRNVNDGDNNFKKGSMITNRLDLLSEFDFRFKNAYGFRVSGAAWYDDVYNHTNDNNGTAYVNSTSVPYNQFTSATRKQAQNAEFRDAFVYGNFTPADMNVNVKGGQFTQLYGETLFFGYNGIAAAQTPLDLVRALSVPNSQFKEIALPVKQLSTQIQITPNLTVGAYYQFEWKKNRIPAAGSYFSFADFADAGGESIVFPGGGPNVALHRGQDIKAKDSGQGGAQVKFKLGDSEFGLYAAQFHDKMPQIYARPGMNGQGMLPSGVMDVGDYSLVYSEKIKTYGASISTLVGETNVAAELSVRKNMPMVARGILVNLGQVANFGADGGGNPAYPVGDSLHFNLSAISVLGATPLWHGASFIGEFAYNQRMRITKNADQLDPNATKTASAIQFVFQPEYFQVLPGLDLQVPIGVGYGINGHSSVAGVSALMPSERGGNVSIGIKGEYQKTWQTSLNYTKYFGPKDAVIDQQFPPALSYKNFHGDRDFISLSVQRTF